MPIGLKRFLNEFNVVAIHTGLIFDKVIFRLESQYPKYLIFICVRSPQGKHFMQNMGLKSAEIKGADLD